MAYFASHSVSPNYVRLVALRPAIVTITTATYSYRPFHSRYPSVGLDCVTLHTPISSVFDAPVDAILTCGGGGVVAAYMMGLLCSRPSIYIGGFTRRLLDLIGLVWRHKPKMWSSADPESGIWTRTTTSSVGIRILRFMKQVFFTSATHFGWRYSRWKEAVSKSPFLHFP